MSKNPDDKFYDRADAHIQLSNEQVNDIGAGKVSASMMYGTARFNAWINASGFSSGEEMRAARTETLKYFVKQYRLMLAEHLDDYIENFDKYMDVEKPPKRKKRG